MDKKTYTLQPAGDGFFVYDSGFFLGWTPTILKARHLIPRATVKLGVASPTSEYVPLRGWVYGWLWQGQQFPRGGVGGAGHEGSKVYVDMQTGEAFVRGRRNACLTMARPAGAKRLA